MRRGVMVCVLFAVTLLSTTGCEHFIDLGCEHGSCHLNLVSGGKVNIGGQELEVEKMDKNSVTLSSNGISVSIYQGLDVDFLGYHLHLGEIRGGEASLDVSEK